MSWLDPHVVNGGGHGSLGRRCASGNGRCIPAVLRRVSPGLIAVVQNRDTWVKGLAGEPLSVAEYAQFDAVKGLLPGVFM